MKKRLFSILLALCMVLCLVPTTAFAESETEEPPVCSCETACTAEAMNADCPICGAEGALPENCAKCAQPADDAAVQPEGEVSDPQPEGEVSDPQPETALTALIGGNETAKDVSTAEELTAAIADVNFDTVRLTGDISISSTLTVNRTVTLDLNGHVLKYESANNGSVIVVEGSGQLTIEDSNTSNLSHKFNPNGKLWVLDEASGTETVTGGIITGGTGYPFHLISGTVNCGGGVYIAPGGQLTMTGGNIIGCSAEFGGGVCAYGTFKMSGQAVIRSCTAESATQYVCGGGVYVDGSFEMSGEATIKGCQAISDSANGGGVFVNSSRSFVMSNEAKIENCQAISNSSRGRGEGGGVYLANNTKFTLSGSAVIQNCTATNSANSGEAYGGGVSAACVKEITLADSARIVGCAAANGSGLYITGSQVPGYGILHANGGSVDGDVVLGDTEDGPSTITGSGGTVFNGKVTVTPGSTIESGTFNGEVINNGTITGGVFNNTVSGSGTITGGTFNTPMTGSGTESDPYQISTADQLKLFRDIVNGSNGQTQNRGAYAVLTANIDLNNEPWTPIGNYTEGNQIYYEGTFDGGGYTISGLNVTGKFRCASLFGAVKGGTIKNLTVAGNVSHNYSSTGLDCHVGGIVGSALDAATIENCSNNCSVTGGSGDFIGGIAGSNINNARIIDCYNVGTITGTIIETGGVTGLNMGTISNCYNVGTIKMLHNSNAVGEIVGNNVGTVKNCYYLAGTNLNAVGQSNNGSITKTESKTAAEFANGDVLEELKAGQRDNNADPWADECKYLAAAGKTLPVFNGQGDAHDHQSNDWKSNETEHWQVCTCGAVFHKAEHSGGTATCIDKAVCEFCKAEYGEKLPHDFTAETVDAKYLKSAATCTGKAIYYKSCAVCGLSSEGTADEATFFSGNALDHDWGAWTQNSDEKTHTRICKRDTSHTETENCHGGTATCTAKAVCEVCKSEYGEKLPHDFTAETVDAKYLKSAATCTGKAIYYKSCAVCGLSSEGTADEATFFSGNALDHDWGAWTQNSDEKTHTRICKRDTSHTETENCHGGTATCKAQAICEICGDSYGSLDPNNHTDLKHIDAKAATAAEEGNIAYWYCDGCKKYFSDAAATKEITKAATVTAKLPPKITAGDGAAVTQGEKKELTFTSDASFADFVRVELDGTALEEKNYTKREGSTIITLNRDFVAALSVGEHTLAIVSQHGTATAKFTVKAKPTETATPQPTMTPQPTAQPTPTVQPVSPILRTGDTANPALWFALLIVSGGAAIGTTVASRKKKHNK